MTTTILERTVGDIKDKFDLEALGIRSLLIVLEDLALESNHSCSLPPNDPAHPGQQMHALVKALMRQFDAADALVQSIESRP